MSYNPHKISFQRLPAVKLFCGVAVGLAFGWLMSSVILYLLAALGFMLGLASMWGNIGKKRQDRQSALSRTAQKLHARECAYWCMAIALGGIICHEAAGSSIESDLQAQFVPEQSAVLQGEITRVLRTDSAFMQVLVRGSLDTKAFPRLDDVGVILTIRGVNHANSYTTGTSIYAVVKARFPQKPLLPTDSDEIRYAATQGSSFLASADTRSIALLGSRRTFNALLADWAMMLEKRVNTFFPEETAPFALALLTGNAQHIPLSTKQDFMRSGTIHVLAVSGLHIGLVGVMLFLPLAFVQSVVWRWFLAVSSVALFVLLTGSAPSAMRSGLMFALFLLAQANERRSELLNLLALSALLLLVWKPVLLHSAGFQMSVASVFGIALLQRLFRRVFLRLLGVRSILFAEEYPFRNNLAGALAVSAAASVAVAPVVAWYFGVVSFVSIAANLAIVPLSSFAMLYTLASVITSAFWTFGAEIFATTAHYFLSLMNSLNSFAASGRYAALEGRFALIPALAMSFASVYLAQASVRSARLLLFRVFVLICVGSALWLGFGDIERDGNIKQTSCTFLPREQLTAAIIPCSERHLLVLLADRRIHTHYGVFARLDVGLEKFLREESLEKRDSLTVIALGASSMLVSARLAQNLNASLRGNTTPVKPVSMRVLAGTLLLKNRRFFAALDTLQNHKIAVINLGEYFRQRALKQDSTVLLREIAFDKTPQNKTPQNKTPQNTIEILQWKPWSGLIEIRGKRDTVLLLPKILHPLKRDFFEK